MCNRTMTSKMVPTALGVQVTSFQHFTDICHQGESNMHQVVIAILCCLSLPPFCGRGNRPFLQYQAPCSVGSPFIFTGSSVRIHFFPHQEENRGQKVTQMFSLKLVHV